MKYLAGHNGARRKLARYLAHVDRVLTSAADSSEQYDEIVGIAIKVYHVLGDVSKDDFAQAGWSKIQETLRELDYECYQDDVLDAYYS